MSAASAAALAILLGLVVPLALGSTGWQQRGALALLVLAGLWRGRGRLPTLGGSGTRALASAALVVVAATLPLAAQSERSAGAASERRAGERLAALGEPERAAEHLERAGADEAAAAVHLELAESAVASGLSASAYARAAAHLDAAIRLAPSRDAQRLGEAVAAVRHADIIWNEYDWPRTIAELRKAQVLRPDLPGLVEKLAAAEASYALVRRSVSP